MPTEPPFTVVVDEMLPPDAWYLISMPYDDWVREQATGADTSVAAWASACVRMVSTDD
jgi:hypothetical protein